LLLTPELVTSLGAIELTIQEVKRGGRVTSPLIDALGIRRKRYSQELRMILADMTARLSYGDTRKQFLEINGIDVPEQTIHSFLQEIGAKLGDASDFRRIEEEKKKEEPIVVLADGTKTHSIYQTRNNVKVAILYDQKSGEKRIVSIGVNNGWKDAEGRRTQNDTFVVSDAEEEIPEKVTHSELQIDLVHAVRDALYRMWMDGSSREEESKQLSQEMKRILYTLVYSVRKHLKDKDGDALSHRIESTIKERRNLAESMEERGGYLKTSNFILAHARLMVTFAKVTLERGISIPYTSNAIERLMGEISKRCKHKWMH
jgi:hypothetical protein